MTSRGLHERWENKGTRLQVKHERKGATPTHMWVNLGTAAFVPFDGSRMRLRTSNQPVGEMDDEDRYVALEIVADGATRALVTDRTIWPQPTRLHQTKYVGAAVGFLGRAALQAAMRGFLRS